MYAVVEIQGSQFKVEKDQKLFVNRIDAKEGSKVSFDNVLLVDDGKKFKLVNQIYLAHLLKLKLLLIKKMIRLLYSKRKEEKAIRLKMVIDNQ
jgi:large subunit ribosomal protein L21